MSNIKSGEPIMASDIQDLKTRVLALYSTSRKYLGDVGLISVSDSSAGHGTTAISTGNYINENFYFLLNALLQLNNITGVTKNEQYQSIFQTGTLDDLLSLISSWETTDPKAAPTSCRGGCVGFCYSTCADTCTFQCHGSNDSSVANPGGQWPGQQTLPGCNGCQSACTSCTNGCLSTCKDGCGASTCRGSCAGDCHSGCAVDCTGLVGEM